MCDFYPVNVNSFVYYTQHLGLDNKQHSQICIILVFYRRCIIIILENTAECKKSNRYSSSCLWNSVQWTNKAIGQ